MKYLGAWGTLIYEKNLKSKISCQTPFNSYVDMYGCLFEISAMLLPVGKIRTPADDSIKYLHLYIKLQYS
jgi:hypothetical protein